MVPRACPRMHDLVYPSRTRAVLSVLVTENGDRVRGAGGRGLREPAATRCWQDDERVHPTRKPRAVVKPKRRTREESEEPRGGGRVRLVFGAPTARGLDLDQADAGAADGSASALAFVRHGEGPQSARAFSDVLGGLVDLLLTHVVFYVDNEGARASFGRVGPA